MRRVEPGLLQPGERVARKLVIRRAIGRGTSALVYLAEHVALGTPVAVKVLPTESRDWRTVERFRREARFQARVDSVHVPRVFDVGHLEDGSAYVLMEHVEGNPLEALLEEGPLPVPAAIAVGRQLLTVLADLHRVGVLHRDIKPGNVIVQRRDTGEAHVKLLDFGVSKSLVDGQSPRVTAEGAVVGTPSYMAPEQARGDPLDERADLYAVGAVLYHALTGRPPFERASVGDTLAAVLRDPILPARVLHPGCPPQLEALLMRALAKDPSLRPASAAEMSADLARIDRVPAPPTDRSEDDTEPALKTMSLRESTAPFELRRPVAPMPAVVPAVASLDAGIDDDPPQLPLSASWLLVMSALALAAGWVLGFLLA